MLKQLLITAALTAPLAFGVNQQPNIIPAAKVWKGAEGSLDGSKISKITYAKAFFIEFNDFGITIATALTVSRNRPYASAF